MSVPPAPASSTVSDNSTVYYAGRYWNDFPTVIAYLSERFTGDPGAWWLDDVKARFCSAPLGRVLVLNCGNGWVERDLVDRGIAARVVAFDYSWALLETARSDRGERPIHYFRADANALGLAPDSLDAVINVASLHHVQYLNRLCWSLCAALKPTGILASFDYIGPHRNQYSREHWRLIEQVNRRLPPALRRDLHPAHLPTMLHTDPTEAIHSELILSSLASYFDVFERHDGGGGIAYEILTHNAALHALEPAAADPHVREVLAWDRHYTDRGTVPPLFSYFLARPRKSVLTDPARLRSLLVEEERREAWARKHRGVYSWADYLVMLRHRAGVRWRASPLHRWLARLR